MRWTTSQDEILRAYGHEGVVAIQRRLLDECGVEHTVRAIEMHASRIHASLKVRGVCPECGVIGAAANRQSGLCPLCSSRQHVEEARAFNEILREEIAVAEGSPEIAENEREYNRLRQENSRLCRRYGLKSKTQRGRDAKAAANPSA